MTAKKKTLGLPEEVIFCKKCVISNQRPSSSIEFKNHQGEKNKLSILMKIMSVQLAVIMKKKK